MEKELSQKDLQDIISKTRDVINKPNAIAQVVTGDMVEGEVLPDNSSTLQQAKK